MEAAFMSFDRDETERRARTTGHESLPEAHEYHD
jgi:hypothetical protein